MVFKEGASFDDAAISRQVRRRWLDVFYFFLGAGILALIAGILLSRTGGTRLLITLIVGFPIASLGVFFVSPIVIRQLFELEEASKEEYPELHRAMEEMDAYQRLWIKPTLFIAKMEVPNAFAFGYLWFRGIAVTHELLAELEYKETKSVLGHELAHILMRDILLATVFSFFISWLEKASAVFSTVGGPAGAIAGPLAKFVFSGLAAVFQAGLSQAREYSADALSVRYTGSVDSMISALRKIESAAQAKVSGEADKLSDEKKSSKSKRVKKRKAPSIIEGLTISHPEMDKRVAALESLTLGKE